MIWKLSNCGLFSTKCNFILILINRPYKCFFSRKRIKPDHPLIFVNDTAVNQLLKHTHLQLTFAFHIQEAITKARKGIGVLRFMSKYLHRDVLDQLYKLYVRPHLDYCDIIYHKHDLNLKLDFTKKCWNLFNILRH